MQERGWDCNTQLGKEEDKVILQKENRSNGTGRGGGEKRVYSNEAQSHCGNISVKDQY